MPNERLDKVQTRSTTKKQNTDDSDSQSDENLIPEVNPFKPTNRLLKEQEEQKLTITPKIQKLIDVPTPPPKQSPIKSFQNTVKNFIKSNSKENLETRIDKYTNTSNTPSENSENEEEIQTPKIKMGEHEGNHQIQHNFLTFRDIAQIIRPFNGNNQDVECFLTDVTRAAKMVNENYIPNFINFIKLTKLVGDISSLALDKTHNTINDFKNFIRTIYSPRETVYEDLGKLTTIYQHENEKVLQYYSRIINLANRIINNYPAEIKALNPSLSETEVTRDITRFTDHTNKLIHTYFIKGLKRPIRNQVIPQDDITKTLQLADEIEKDLEKYDTFRHEEISTKFKSFAINYKTPSEPEITKINAITTTNTITCQYCGKSGHILKNCYSFINQQKSNNYSTNRQNITSQNKYCTICKTNTHDTNICYKNNNKQQTSVNRDYCTICKRNGHKTDNCYSKNKNSQNYKICEFCENKGHNIKECRKMAYAKKQLKIEKQNPKNGNTPLRREGPKK